MTTTARKIARKLNDHHMRTCAGFYASGDIDHLGRCFMARTVKGELQVSTDFGRTWHAIDWRTCKFKDHNGRPIYLQNEGDKLP